MMMKEEEEEEAVTSNGMNDDTINIYSYSDSDNNRIGEDNCNLNQVWRTPEELLLSFAVKRHGFTDWDTVAKEVRSRSSINASPGNCRLKYLDLKSRFKDSIDAGEKNIEAEEEDGEIPWLEKLRSLRVAELRREVQRCDDSILSLQLKVKKLEEEKDENDGNNKPDLEVETEPARLNRETTESDRENRSMNESNSTASVDKIADHVRLSGHKMVQACENSINPDPDPVYKVAAAKKEEEGTVSRGSEMSHSGELGESGTSTGRGKRKGRKYRSGEDCSIRGGDIKSASNKSQPLIEIMELIRSHPRGSVFESRLRSQETKNYKLLIRQHLDIKTIEKKLKKGSYVSSSLSFYRDLKLLFTNAIVFFPPSSSESMAAQELRTLVSNEIKKETGKLSDSVIKTEAESSVSRQKSSVPSLVVCKKKSSVSKKVSSSSSSLKQKNEKKSQEVSEEKKTVTTTANARSSRRMSKGISVVAKDTKTVRAKKQTDSSNDDDGDDEKEEIVKTEKKKGSEKKKSVADFLKRIKKNSPETTSKSDVKEKQRELRSNKKIEVENNSNKSSLKRKQTKKEVEAKGKRGRESEKDKNNNNINNINNNNNNKQPKKRSRR